MSGATGGVALLAEQIRSLNRVVVIRDKKIESLRTRIAALERCVKAADVLFAHLAEYSNGCENDRALADAVEHMTDEAASWSKSAARAEVKL